MVREEEYHVRGVMAERAKEGTLKPVQDVAKSAPKRRGRWDQTAEEATPAKKKPWEVDVSRKDILLLPAQYGGSPARS